MNLRDDWTAGIILGTPLFAVNSLGHYLQVKLRHSLCTWSYQHPRSCTYYEQLGWSVPNSMRKILRENGLSIVFGLFFFLFLAGQAAAGMYAYNEEQQEHGQPALGFSEYLTSAHFLEATMENWESEFLQMFAFVLLTAFLFQKGSAESKKLDEPAAQDPRKSRNKKDAPWPVRKGGLILKLYKYSLSLAFLLLFLMSFTLHAIGGAEEYNQNQREHGSSEVVSTLEYIGTSKFWFESFQNWQSEFLAVGAMVVLSIFLRQQGSPESKPVDSPHSETGGE